MDRDETEPVLSFCFQYLFTLNHKCDVSLGPGIRNCDESGMEMDVWN